MGAVGAFAKAERMRNKRRFPIRKVPAAARVTFHCERWSCSISRWSCALRWLRSSSTERVNVRTPIASTGYERCRKCSIGEGNAQLIPADKLLRKDGER